jgi:hypothetical protein
MMKNKAMAAMNWPQEAKIFRRSVVTGERVDRSKESVNSKVR